MVTDFFILGSKLSERQKQLLRKLAEISGEKRNKGIFEKVKERI